MKKMAAGALLMWAACLYGLQAHATPLPQELRAALPSAALSGQATMTFWGLKVYRARLWVTPAFVAAAYEQSAFALELAYLRDFKGADIASRSLTEMRRQGSIDAQRAMAWESRLRDLFPDVKPGDSITGVNQPGKGALFLSNGRVLGDIPDPQFAKMFFGIWLAPQSSEPQLRQELLALARALPANGSAP